MSPNVFEKNEDKLYKDKCCGEFFAMFYLVMLKKKIRTSRNFARPAENSCFWSYGASIILSKRWGLSIHAKNLTLKCNSTFKIKKRYVLELSVTFLMTPWLQLYSANWLRYLGLYLVKYSKFTASACSWRDHLGAYQKQEVMSYCCMQAKGHSDWTHQHILSLVNDLQRE